MRNLPVLLCVLLSFGLLAESLAQIPGLPEQTEEAPQQIAVQRHLNCRMKLLFYP